MRVEDVADAVPGPDDGPAAPRRPHARPPVLAKPLAVAVHAVARTGEVAGRRIRTPAESRRGVDTLARVAVPKQKQSHSRTNKRRSQHKLEARQLTGCPNCHSPRLAHRVCSVCGFYAGREVMARQPDVGE